MNVLLNEDHGTITERKSRLTTHQPIDVQPQSGRSASQPPRTAGTDIPSSPLGRRFDGHGSLSSVPWTQSSRYVPINRTSSLAVPQSVPTRSSSFSHDRGLQSSSTFGSFRSSAFASTFEDDESEIMSDDMSQGQYDNVSDLSQIYRGRAYSPDNNRSRSQSLAGLRTADTTGLSFHRPNPPNHPQSWKESFLHPGTLSAQLSGYGFPGDTRPSISRLSSYGGKSANFPPASSPLRSTEFRRDASDISNISPFLRDVNPIFLEDAPLRDLWGSGISQKEENWAPGSGNTSRRHSVSVVQPRRGGSGLNTEDESAIAQDHETNFNLQRSFQAVRHPVTTNELTDELNRLHLSFNGTQGDRVENGRHFHDTHHQPASAYQLLEATDSTLSPIDTTLSVNTTTRKSTTPYGEINTSDSPTASLGIYKHDVGSANHSRRFVDRSVASGESLGTIRSPSSLPQYNLAGYTTQYVPTETPSSMPPESMPKSHGPQPEVAELGRGLPLHSIPHSCPLYIVEFKAGRTDLFYTADGAPRVNAGDLVIVEADRGKDLGKVINDTITHTQLEEWQATRQFSADSPVSPGGHIVKKELNPKRIYGRANAHDTQLLIAKAQDEDKALQLCQSKVKQKKMPMEVIDAEYQWDRRKLTFYFIADKRIDFRELVRELFRLYKTRIWMASLSQTSFGSEQ